MVGDGREVDGVKRIGSRQVLVLPQRNLTGDDLWMLQRILQ